MALVGGKGQPAGPAQQRQQGQQQQVEPAGGGAGSGAAALAGASGASSPKPLAWRHPRAVDVTPLSSGDGSVDSSPVEPPSWAEQLVQHPAVARLGRFAAQVGRGRAWTHAPCLDGRSAVPLTVSVLAALPPPGAAQSAAPEPATQASLRRRAALQDAVPLPPTRPMCRSLTPAPHTPAWHPLLLPGAQPAGCGHPGGHAGGPHASWPRPPGGHPVQRHCGGGGGGRCGARRAAA